MTVACLKELLDSLEPKWVVNNMGELGVEVAGRVFFLYKGGNLEYDEPTWEDDGHTYDLLYRRVGKREFGETVWPWQWHVNGRAQRGEYTAALVPGTWGVDGSPACELDEDEHWRPLPMPLKVSPDS